MFTGLIEDIGTLAEFRSTEDGAQLEVHTRLVTESGLAGPAGIGEGDSIAVDGCCLTATQITEKGFTAEASGETLARTTLGQAKPGTPVNLERAMVSGGRMGGHLVQGHVDGIGEIQKVQNQGENRIVHFSADKQITDFIAEKGSITIDGVSLTVNGVEADSFWVTLIPFTLAHTTLGQKKQGLHVNLETDVIAKYVVRYLTATGARSS